MVIFLIIVLYFLVGLAIACAYNAATLVPPPWDMSKEQKHRMFLITIIWPIWFTYGFIKEVIECTKWLIKERKK